MVENLEKIRPALTALEVGDAVVFPINGRFRAGREVCLVGPDQQGGCGLHALEGAAGHAGTPAEAGLKGGCSAVYAEQ